MSDVLRVRELRVYRLAIPMRLRFEHAKAERDVADPIIVAAAGAAPHAHIVGYGETLARPYVTGETAESVLLDVAGPLAAPVRSFRADSFVSALEQIDALPYTDDGRMFHAARAAVELALLDLVCRVFRRRPSDVAGWMGLAGFGPPGSIERVRYSGVVLGRTRGRLRWLLRLQRLAGLRDFKIKVATAGWEQRLRWASEALGPALRRGALTLRADANAGWSLAEAAEALPLLEDYGVSLVEQPLPDIHDADLPYLAEQSRCGLMVDESLLSIDDARRLIDGGGVRAFNIRIAKHGGFMPALRIGRLALSHGIDVHLGCLVGETSLLAAAGVAFLETCPRVRYVEGAYAPWMLRRDIVRSPVRFGLGGRIRPRKDLGWGVAVDDRSLEALAVDRPRVVVG